MNTPFTPRLVAAAAAFAMSALILGSQLGLANHLSVEADALLAVQRGSLPMAQIARPSDRHHRHV